MSEECQNQESQASFDRMRLGHQISSVTHGVQMLRVRIENRYLHRGRSTSTDALAEILLRLLSRLHEELRTLHKEIDIHPLVDTLPRLQNINYIITRMVPRLERAMEQAEQDTAAVSVIEAYAELANSVRYGTQTIIHPTLDYNASFDEIMQDLRAMATSLGQEGSQTIFSGAPPRFIIMTYPAAENAMVLRLAYLAHEMGHFIDSELGLSEALQDARVFEEEEILQIRRSVRSQTRGRPLQIPEHDVEILAGEFAAQWLSETVADFLGLCVLGPASLLAFDDMTFTPSGSPPTKLLRSHPPVQLRIAVMAKLVNDKFLSPVRSERRFARLSTRQKDVFATVLGWVRELSTMEPLRFSTVEGVPGIDDTVAQAIYVALAAAVRRAADWLGEKQMSRLMEKPWVCRVTDLVDALELQPFIEDDLIPTILPPDVKRDPSFSAVMNCGWFHLLHTAEEFQYFRQQGWEPTRGETMINWINLQNLIGKAIESLHFKREYNRRKGILS